MPGSRLSRRAARVELLEHRVEDAAVFGHMCVYCRPAATVAMSRVSTMFTRVNVPGIDGRWRLPARIEHAERNVERPVTSRTDRRGPWTTISGRPIAALYTPADIAALDYQRDLGDPGQFPYTRGIHPTGYRGKLWTMRQFAGFGTPEETNARYKQLLADGRHGPERRVRPAHAHGARSGS